MCIRDSVIFKLSEIHCSADCAVLDYERCDFHAGHAEGKLKELKSVVYSESIKTDDYFAQTLDVDVYKRQKQERECRNE